MSIQPGRSRILAVGLLVVVLLILIRVLLVPLWTSWQDYGARIDALENQLAVYERLSEGLEDSQLKLEALKANQPTDDWYLREATPALAAAGLQQLLHRQVTSSGGQVISTQIINVDANEAPVDAVSIQVHMNGDLSDLVNLLYNVESSRPVLFIDNLRVLSNPRRQVRTARNNQLRQRLAAIPELDIRFDLTGYAGREGR